MLQDLLAPDLDLVICGTAAGKRSAAQRQYYAGRGNRLWETLAEIGLTPRQLAPSEYALLPSFGIGLTDVVKAQVGADRDVDFSRSDPGALWEKMVRFSPGLLCFNGKRAAEVALARGRIAFGVQPETFGSTRLFVAPSTSGAAIASWDVDVWRDLAARMRDAG